MMPAPRYEKLGLLALLAIASVITFLFLLGIRTAPTDTFHTFFDETVQGLERGAHVKYRGVRIGSVGDIRVAPDGRHIDVTLEIDRERAQHLDLAERTTDLRARLTIIGITGLKLVDLEPASPAGPSQILTFPTPPNTIPSRLSLTGTLETIVDRIGDDVPDLGARVVAALDAFEGLAQSVRSAELPTRLGSAMDRVSALAGDLRHTIQRFNEGALPATAKIAQTLGRIDDLIDSARRAVESFTGGGLTKLARGALPSANDLDRTLRDLRDAARAIRRFFEQLERQPDMIVKGKARP